MLYAIYNVFLFRLGKLLTCLFTIQTCFAYQMYQERFPNGKMVPHPCKPNVLWKGVGHTNLNGGGLRNPFGDDFKNNGGVCTVYYQMAK